MSTSPWHAFDAIHLQNALPETWQELLADNFGPLKILCLKQAQHPATQIPCPKNCGCFHRVLHRHDATGAIAICRCMPANCPDFPVTLEQITPLQVNAPRFARALADAFACQPAFSETPLPATFQFGTWSTDSVPVILTMQTNHQDFRTVASELGFRQGRPYILFAPTTALQTTVSQELIAHAKAALFTLDSTLTLRANGTIASTRDPAELFAQFTPEPEKRPTHSAPPKPRYALRKGLGVWHLVFDYQEADIRHEKGIFYVAWLLYNPPEHPIHALDLAAKVPEIYRQQLGLPPLVDPVTGKATVLPSTARIQERSLALDDAQAMRRLYRKEKELEAILDADDATEPEKAEALRELEEIVEFQRHHASRTTDAAQKAVWAVRNAIRRFHQNLLSATSPNGDPHPVLRQFANHLQTNLLLASARFSGPNARRARGPTAGSFTYEPPATLTWVA